MARVGVTLDEVNSGESVIRGRLDTLSLKSIEPVCPLFLDSTGGLSKSRAGLDAFLAGVTVARVGVDKEVTRPLCKGVVCVARLLLESESGSRGVVIAVWQVADVRVIR